MDLTLGMTADVPVSWRASCRCVSPSDPDMHNLFDEAAGETKAPASAASQMPYAAATVSSGMSIALPFAPRPENLPEGFAGDRG